jgi:tight adherence protein C
MVWALLLLLVGIVAVAAILVLIGLREREGDDPLAKRLAEYASRGEVATLEEIELSQPFIERVVYPAAKKFGELAQRFTPQNAIVETRRKLERANAPRWLEPTLFLSSRIVFGLGMGALIFLVFSFSPSMDVLSVSGLLMIGGFTLAGFYLPNLVIDRNIRRKQRLVLNAMPDALDLLTICVEAGLGFDAAMAKVSEKWENHLSLGFARAIREVQLGKTRREALRVMAERMGIAEMTSFVAAVIQSEMLGVSLAKVLRIQSDQMRLKRRQRAEEAAHKAPIKMLIPMALLIFPSIMIILMVPALFQIMGVFGGGGGF